MHPTSLSNINRKEKRIWLQVCYSATLSRLLLSLDYQSIEMTSPIRKRLNTTRCSVPSWFVPTCSSVWSAALPVFPSDKPHKKGDSHTGAWHRTTRTPATFYLAFVLFWLTYLPLRFWAASTSSNYFRLGVCSSWGQSRPSAAPKLNRGTAFTIYDVLYHLNL